MIRARVTKRTEKGWKVMLTEEGVMLLHTKFDTWEEAISKAVMWVSL